MRVHNRTLCIEGHGITKRLNRWNERYNEYCWLHPLAPLHCTANINTLHCTVVTGEGHEGLPLLRCSERRPPAETARRRHQAPSGVQSHDPAPAELLLPSESESEWGGRHRGCIGVSGGGRHQCGQELQSSAQMSPVRPREPCSRCSFLRNIPPLRICWIVCKGEYVLWL